MANLEYITENRLLTESRIPLPKGFYPLFALIAFFLALSALFFSQALPVAAVCAVTLALMAYKRPKCDLMKYAGYLGESNVLKALMRLPADYIVLNQVKIPNEMSSTGYTECDFIIIGRKYIFNIEVKNQSGTIYASNRSATWKVVKDPDLEMKDMRNPIRQAYGQHLAIKSFIAGKELSDLVFVRPLVVLANQSCRLVFEEKYPSMRIIKGCSKLVDYIVQVDKDSRIAPSSSFFSLQKAFIDLKLKQTKTSARNSRQAEIVAG